MRKGFAVNLKRLLKVNHDFPGSDSGSLCFLCSAYCCDDNAICENCDRDLPTNKDGCPLCGRPNSFSQPCGNCLNNKTKNIDSIRTLYVYRYPVTHVIQHMKFKQELNLANHLGKKLAATLTQLQPYQPDCIIPVPLHSQKILRRGYNQAIELARPIAKQLGVLLDTSSCKRHINTLSQTGLKATERRKNIKGAFQIQADISYEHVLLIDDVITTGSTINELAKTLRRAGVKRIDALACASANYS